ncbi:sulfite exporter TauE/SafE family protein [Grimontia sp. NTOU-MAR1]|uniref:sulfite exporter TauE/SafE family protein n=1 Tax=Grimontia sp. NTOU-MAR1 TaxID=3111011 RepID=UPI002DC03223|nr:sulfite exporter TauE/SafE family protein [Grimontia sp. NTOU-MAR1]WRW00553.1 sulfite exporter TauE/SafE family protein [Grimontia sp. NTOU-MAR1]
MAHLDFITDPLFYLMAIPAVLIYGIGKGGLGGALGIIAVPLMALTIAPTQAAAILLPILLVMDVFAVGYHYRNADYSVIKQMLPGALAGVVLAGLYMQAVSQSGLKLTIGILSLWFCGQYLLSLLGIANPARRSNNALAATMWGGVSGFSSTTIHAGGGPVSIYLLPLRLEKVSLVATMAVFFAILNVVKLIPYAALGEFDANNLSTALILMPLAPLGVVLGVKLLYRVSQARIYQLCYLFLFLSGLKLSVDGINGLL